MLFQVFDWVPLSFHFIFSEFLPAFAFHLSSISTGIFCLHSFFGSDILYIILFALVGYSILLLANSILKQYQGIVSVFACFTFLIIWYALSLSEKEYCFILYSARHLLKFSFQFMYLFIYLFYFQWVIFCWEDPMAPYSR